MPVEIFFNGIYRATLGPMQSEIALEGTDVHVRWLGDLNGQVKFTSPSTQPDFSNLYFQPERKILIPDGAEPILTNLFDKTGKQAVVPNELIIRRPHRT